MQVDNLISSLVSYEDYERPVVLLDIVIDEDRNPWVQLLSHWKFCARSKKEATREPKKMRNDDV